MAKAKTTAGRSNLKPFYLLLGIIAIVGVALIIVASNRKPGGAAAMDLVDLGALDNRALVEKAKPVAMGQDAAPVKVLVFSDYQCPGCGHFATNIFPELKREFIDTGKVQFMYYDFPLGPPGHPHSFVASRAARCAGDQGKFWELHDYLLANQNSWSYSRTPPIEQFVQYGQQLGVDRAALETCINSDEHAEVVTANYQLGQQLGVGSTPTVIIDGRHSMSPLDWNGLRTELRRATGEE